MASVNKAIILGHLGQDPEMRYAPSGDAICNLSIATTETWKDKATGDKKEATEWHRVSAFGKLAEICGEYLKKGSAVYIEGKIQTRKWQDKDGKDRYTTEIRADTMKMLGDVKKREQDATPEPKKPANAGGGIHDMESDIPFANPYRGKLAYIAERRS